MYLQYGCGLCAPPEWNNFDSSPTLRFEKIPFLGRLFTKNESRFPINVRYGSIVKGLPIAPNSCQGIYCSHVLEHLSFEDLILALKNTYTYLNVGGLFRAVLPDLRYLVTNYIQSNDEMAAINFMKTSGLGQEKRAYGLINFIKEWLGNSQHRWLWDQRSLSKILVEIGFKNVRTANFGDSEDHMFKLVEDQARFGGSFAIQCSK